MQKEEPPISRYAYEHMIKISATHICLGKFYRASPRVVWDIITDTAKWPCWGPTVKDVQLPERFIHYGSKGRVLTLFGIWAPFVIVKFDDGSFWSWKVASINATGHRIQSMHRDCNLWFEVPIIAAPYVLVCQVALNRIQYMLFETTGSNRWLGKLAQNINPTISDSEAFTQLLAIVRWIY